LTTLPDDAFSRMPHLRVLDLSFNQLTTLPESFYRLTDLAEVDLRYTHLDRATIDRLTSTFPRVRLDLRNVASADTTTAEVDDPHWRHVHGLVKAAAQQGNTEQAATDFEQALASCTPGSRYSEYDQLYAYYRLVDVLDHLIREAGNEQAADALRRRLVHHAQAALDLLPQPGFIWHFTQFGAFQEEVTRRTGNALAWTLMQLGELNQARSVADRALTFADGSEFDYIRDTEVRILLAAGRVDEAYRIVDQVLTRDPDFDDFQDLKDEADYQAWRAANS
jgi:tetratricopeptide (TPR) repeat protein